MNQVTLIANNRADCLERILQRTRHRGFAIQQLSMQSLSSKHNSVTMVVSGERQISLLANQLMKLHDIVEVNVEALAQEDENYARTA